MSTPAAEIKKTQTPAKKRDRQRPFLRLEPRPAKDSADGDGFTCGCILPTAFGSDFEKLALDMAQQNMGLLGDFAKVLHDVNNSAPGQIGKILLDAIGLNIVPIAVDAVDFVFTKILGRLVQILIPRAAHVLPQWVPVLKPPSGASHAQLLERERVATDDQLVEVAGIVSRSYQDPIAVPFSQWHRWLNWTFHIKPDSDFEKVLSPAKHSGDGSPILQDGDVECQMDCGALWGDHFKFDAGMKEGDMKFRSGPMLAPDSSGLDLDWAWPMPRQFVWAAGRWVYDCSRPTTDDDKAQMRAMLNPCKAIATVRHAGFQFKENPLPVPATQFMFYTTKRGGYINFDRINDRDYQFIVDLPETNFEQTEPFEIGRTNKIPPFSFDHNTIVIRPRLLKHLNTGAFTNSTQLLDQNGNPRTDVDPKANQHLEPIVEILKPERPGQAPTHVRVTVRTSQLDPKLEAYGFVLSLGWFDPAGKEAEKVRECIVTLQSLESLETSANAGPHRRDKGEIISRILDEIEPEAKKEIAAIIRKHALSLNLIATAALLALADPLASLIWDAIRALIENGILAVAHSREDWLFRVGINGKWKSYFFDNYNPNPGTPRPFNRFAEYKFLNLVTEPVRISMNGLDVDPVGGIMLKPRRAPDGSPERLLDLKGADVPWEQIVRPDANQDRALQIRKDLALRYIFKMIGALADDNDPLGFVDQSHLPPVNENTFPPQNGKPPVLFKNAFVAVANKRFEIVENDKPDYALRYTIEVKKIEPAKQ